MVRRKIAEAVAAMDGLLVAGESSDSFEGVAVDSRSVRGDELFFALAGARTDGHRFVEDASDRGAAGAVVSRASAVAGSRGFALIEVADTYRALHDLTHHLRRQVPKHLVAITGSAGKTTTKELLAAMLSQRYRTASSPGNYNTLYGFPAALASIPDDTEWMVAEMAMSTPGELRQVSELGRPEVAVYTNVRLVHLEAFDRKGAAAGLREIAEAKAELLDGLASEGLVVANAADEEVVRIVARHLEGHPQARVTWYALGSDQAPEETEKTTLEIDQLTATGPGDSESGSSFVLRRGSESVVVELPLHGRVNVENFLAAATCAYELGVSLLEIAAAASTQRAQPGRGAVLRLENGALLVDDSYNSNPEALVAALVAACELDGRRHWAILGSMLELGQRSAELHRQAGREAARRGFSPLIAVGVEARPLAAEAEKGGAETLWYASAEEAAERAAEEIRPGDVVLVKGSRGVGLERVVARVIGSAEGD